VLFLRQFGGAWFHDEILKVIRRDGPSQSMAQVYILFADYHIR